MSKEIKTAIDKAIELDPNNDLAYHALGRWQRTMAEIGGAHAFSAASSSARSQKAPSRNPRRP